MLLTLHIENFVLIDNLDLSFGCGLHVLTGETGTGKSIIVDALSLVMGGRANPSYVRRGTNKAVIEAAFSVERGTEVAELLDANGYEDDILILSREILANGKSLARMNGRLTSVSFQQELGRLLVDIYGQHEHQSLLRTKLHLSLLDYYAMDEIKEAKLAVAESYDQLTLYEQKLTDLGGAESVRLQKIELLSSQIKEINAAQLLKGEEEQLKHRQKILANAESLFKAARSITKLLSGGDDTDIGDVIGLLSKVEGELRSIARIDETLGETAERALLILDQTEDLARDISTYGDDIDYGVEELNQVMNRLDVIAHLRRKYNLSEEELLQSVEYMNEQLEELFNREELVIQLEKEKNVLQDKYVNACLELSEQRKSFSIQLVKGVMSHLSDLGMEKAIFGVDFKLRPSASGVMVNGEMVRASRTGIDKIEFLISTNIGEPLKPLAKIASGGEISRVMLAIKSVLASAGGVPTLIFDEVDAGIGGLTATAVGRKLAYLGGEYQVLCITHLAQIACMADQHWAISKRVDGERTSTIVTNLALEDRPQEIGRMLGSKRDIAIKHADLMLEEAKLLKSNM